MSYPTSQGQYGAGYAPGHVQPADNQPANYTRAQERPWVPQQNPTRVGHHMPWRMPKRHSVGFYVMVIALAVLGVIGFLIILPMLTESAGVRGAVSAGVVALIPVIIVSALVWWIDSWEPEPKWLMIAMFLWGGGVAVAISAWLNTAWSQKVYLETGNMNKGEIWGAIASAPIVEEFAKGLGVVLLFVFFKRYFNGPIDGICYGAMSGLGFAFVENILYFTRFYDDLQEIALLRFSSPLLHPLCTATVGLFLGFAVYARSRWMAIPLLVPGFFIASSIHFMHNGWAVITDVGILLNGEGSLGFLFWVIQIPSYIAALILVLWFRKDEENIIRERLFEYQRAGWFAPHEVAMLTSLDGRRQARSWAGSRGPDAKRAMKQFQEESAHLALNRQRAALQLLPVHKAQREEARTLASITAARQVFMAGVRR
ncbi:PrsW family intramembrane metalloprotease [Flaviflexus massiliensis]|uniref:PrsW family intramembrane metalloprotease n=1 Tax=Flaviflexus massiliensis TaxID=1522309 RepID=UPI0006D564AF|nr:PrsW family intramembrane metalloprotease [Flaviflexus massiliensis]